MCVLLRLGRKAGEKSVEQGARSVEPRLGVRANEMVSEKREAEEAERCKIGELTSSERATQARSSLLILCRPANGGCLL